MNKMSKIIKYILLACFLAIALEGYAQEVAVKRVQSRGGAPFSVGELPESLSLRYSSDTNREYNQVGDKSKDMAFTFRPIRQAIVVIDNANSNLDATTMRLVHSENNDTIAVSRSPKELWKAEYPFFSQEIHSRINNDKNSIGDRQAAIVRTLENGRYILFCEGTSPDGQPVNGIIQTNIHIFYLGETRGDPIKAGAYSKDFTYKDVANFSNLVYISKYYYEIQLDSPMSVDISSIQGEDFALELVSEGDFVAGSEYYQKTDQYSTRIPKKKLLPGKYELQVTIPRFGGKLNLEINGKIVDGIVLGDTKDSPIDIGLVGVDTDYVTTFDTSDYFDDKKGTAKNYRGDVYHKFELASTIDVEITASAVMLGGGKVRLLNSQQQELAMMDTSCGKVLFSGKMSPGVYYLVSEGNRADGEMTLHIQGSRHYEYTPSAGRNYIETVLPNEAVSVKDNSLKDPSKAQHTINYYDFLGRPQQTLQYAASPSRKDLTVHSEYDVLGHEKQKWLPIVSAHTGAYVALDDLKNNASAFYSDSCAYSKIVYENSPLNRIVETYGSGEVWQQTGHGIKNAYRISILSDFCKYFSVDGERAYPTLKICMETYPRNELTIVETEDEDGHLSCQFTDKKGNIILKRQISDIDTLDTYYVYDDFNNLCFVLPPVVSDSLVEKDLQNVLDRYAYQYRYDDRNRCIGKKLPGCDWAEMIYDSADRLIFTRNGEQKKREEWSVRFTDLFGREVLSGLYHGTPDSKECSSWNIHVAFYPDSLSAIYGYVISCPESIYLKDLEILKADYYDTYDYQNYISGFPASLGYVADEKYGQRYVSSQEKSQHNKGLLTGAMTRVLESGQELYSSSYYDYNQQLIQSRHTTVNGKVVATKSAFNFNGQPTVSCEEYDDNIRLEKSYTYDHAKRLIKEVHILGKDVTSFSYSFDETGRIKSLTRINGTDSLTTTNSYNIRSWLTDIDSSVFKQSLHYTDGAGTPCFNGNICSMTWQTDASTIRGYQFSYDELSRLKNALYGEGNTLSANKDHFNEQVTGYDKMGNILGLKRFGQTAANAYGMIDNLTFTYNGNQLKAVEDKSSVSAYDGGFEFKDTAHQPIEYIYDSNGNLIQDLNKKIAGIQYNCLNLPSRIEFENGNSISYLYDANGTKIRTTHVTDKITTTTDYCGNAIYENGVLGKLLTEQGYITLSDAVYHYFLRDHQGNNRVVVNQNGTVEEVNHYYPFGGIFASSPSVQPYKYNGKELDRQSGLDWYDYGARMYDAALGRFTYTDPLAEAWAYVNPYDYCFNNPVNRTDPTGMASVYNWDRERYEDENGNEVSWESVKEEYQIENKDNGNASEQQESDCLSPVPPEVNAILTPWGTAASLHAGLRYTEHPFGGGYFRTKKGEYYSQNIFQQPAGTKLARKAKGMVNSAQVAKNATKLMRGVGNVTGLVTSAISVYNFSLNPNFRDGSDFVFGIGSLAYWEIGLIYLMGSSSYDTSVENQKQIIKNINNGVPASLGTINLQRGMFW